MPRNPKSGNLPWACTAQTAASRYQAPLPALFSFNSAAGACPECRGFGRVIGVDWNLVVPNDKLTLRTGAIKAIQTPAWKEIQDDLLRHAEAEGIPRDIAWGKLTPAQRDWVLDGSPRWNGKWEQTLVRHPPLF